MKTDSIAAPTTGSTYDTPLRETVTVADEADPGITCAIKAAS